MKRYIEGECRHQVTLMPEALEDYINEDNPGRVIDGFVDELDVLGLGFESAKPAGPGRPCTHPSMPVSVISSSAVPRAGFRESR